MDNFITRQEHNEFAKLMESENQRLAEENAQQNHRISRLEESAKEIHSLTVSVERMAVNMENMLAEQRKLSDRMEVLEKEPAEAHKQIKMAVVTAIISAVVGTVIGAVLMLL